MDSIIPFFPNEEITQPEIPKNANTIAQSLNINVFDAEKIILFLGNTSKYNIGVVLDSLKEDTILKEAVLKTNTTFSKKIVQDLFKLKNFHDSKFPNNFEDAFYDKSIDDFYEKALSIRLSDKTPSEQIAAMRKEADSQFTHRHGIRRAIADFFNFFTVVIGLVRLGLGKTFFFSTAPTAREREFNGFIKPGAADQDKNTEALFR